MRHSHYRNPKSVISTLSAEPIQRILLHLSAQHSVSSIPQNYPITTPDGGKEERDAPYHNKTQRPRILPIDKLLRIPQQHVHVRIDALQCALVLCLAPFQAYDQFCSDSGLVSLLPCFLPSWWLVGGCAWVGGKTMGGW